LQESEIKKKLAEQSHEAIKTLIQSAESTRRNKSKSTNFMDSFFKEAKKHIA
jgi:hypothetical protein